MGHSVTDILASQGGRLDPKALGGAAAIHLQQSTDIFRGYLQPILASDPSSPLIGAAPPSRISQFEFVDRWDVNAWAVLAEDRPLILFHAGIPFALFELFSSLLSRNEILSDVFGTDEYDAGAFSPPRTDYAFVRNGSWPQGIPLSQRRIEELLREGHEVHPEAKRIVSWSHYVRPSPRSEGRSKFALQAYVTAIHFLFCHELGHIDHGHLELRREQANSFALDEVSDGVSQSLTGDAFDAALLQCLEIDADAYALARSIDMYLPNKPKRRVEPSLGDRKPGDPQCYRLLLFSIGVLFLFLEHQRNNKPSAAIRRLSGQAPTHPDSSLRIRGAVSYAELLLRHVGLAPQAIGEVSKHALDDLIGVAKLFGSDPAVLMASTAAVASSLMPLINRLTDLRPELARCSDATRKRYYREGKRVTLDEGSKDAEDRYHLRGQAVGIFVNGQEIRIPFLEKDAPVSAFLDNSEKWEKGGYIDNAFVYALLATSRDPNSEVARARLGAVRTMLGSHAAAFERQIEQHGPASHLADRLAEAIDETDIASAPQRAAEVLAEFVALRPLDVPARLRLAACKFILKDLEAADREYRESLARTRSEEDRAVALVGMGNVAAERGLTDGAVGFFEEALAIDDSDVHALRNLGIALVRGNRPAEAIAHFERALEILPEDPELWFKCSAAYYAAERFGEARTRVEKAIELAPEIEHYRQALAQLNQVSGA